MLLHTFLGLNFVTASSGTVSIDTTAKSILDATAINDSRSGVITVASNSNRALFVCTPVGDGTLATRTVDSVASSVDGAFTHVASSDADDGVFLRAEWWYKLNPTVGAHTITVTFVSGGSVASASVMMASLYGVNQSVPVGTPGTAFAAAASGSASVTLASGELALGAVSSDANATLTFTTGTEQQKNVASPTSSPDTCLGMATNTGIGSVAIAFTGSTPDAGYAISVIPVKAQ